MSRTIRAIPVRPVLFTVLVLLVALLLQSMSADAAPPGAPLLGITPTPTETPLPTDTPWSLTDTPSGPTDTPSGPTDTPSGPTDTPSGPTDTPSGPTDTPSSPTDTPSGPTDTPTPTSTGVPIPVGTPTPGPAPDLIIEKRAAPVETYPGGEVTFVIVVTNQGDLAATDVVVTDTLNEYLEILGVETSQGTVSISGQSVRVDVGVVGPGFTVEIAIRVRVREDVPVPSDIANVAVVSSSNTDERSSTVTIRVSTLLTLPEAGRVAWDTVGLLLIAAGGLIALAAMVWSRAPIRH